MVRMNFRSPKPQANPKPGELQHDSDDKDNQVCNVAQLDDPLASVNLGTAPAQQ